MGLSFVNLELSNPKRPELAIVEAEALADTGAVFLILPQHVAVQLQLDETDKKEVTIADGSRRMVPYVGPVMVRFKNRTAFVGAIVMGDQVLLGAIPMEDMDLVVLPKERRVDVNPLNPNFAAAYAKGQASRPERRIEMSRPSMAHCVLYGSQELHPEHRWPVNNCARCLP
ncbi:MAG: clan AA aspartic protease [Phycisphaerae bacterium]|nr:clan AA aspartic protease [Phycisphaerae bacterium]